ncbi:MAG: M1 family metallopeptidase, partial [Gemmatimonadales bacterium]
AFFPALPSVQRAGTMGTITVHYHGVPQVAKRPPWEGGFSWLTDSLGRPWIVTTDQGMGASVWWPNKDTQADEPDSQRVAITVPAPLVNVSNGRLRRVVPNSDGTTTYEWFVTNPINNYAIAVAAGNYSHWSETYDGEGGVLTMDYWPLDYNLQAAMRQWTQARSMMQCFEHWFGPYPWYADGYKMIEVPNAGMEHQSAVAYGNWFRNGYRDRDLSGTGLGLTFDFIIIHESAHEWWGNNITTRDMADMWVHESFANYSEGIYVECQQGKEAGARYTVGSRLGIRNDRPIIPVYGVNAQGSGDMYPKGGNMLHTIRQLVNNDAKWRGILRGLNSEFRHQTVTGAQVEQYITRESGLDLSKVFDQYLRDTRIPVLEHRAVGGAVEYRWNNVVAGFNMPVRVRFGDGAWMMLRPTAAWQRVAVPSAGALVVDENYYVKEALVDK